LVKNILERFPNKISKAKEEISKSIKYASQVSAWGTFSLARIRQEKRRKKKIAIDKIVHDTVNDVKAIFDAIDIKVKLSLEPIITRTYAMDVEAIVLNLLTNAYTACQQNGRKRIINIKIKRETLNKINGFSIVASDTGPGVDVEIREMIWGPLFTTKVDQDGKEIGTGLGLTIIDSIISELKGERKVDVDPVLKGARFWIWIPIDSM
jgi:signal transduction histidine kinase